MRTANKPRQLVVRPRDGGSRGTLTFGPFSYPCALGRSGLTYVKREGDGATPIGCWPLLFGFYRADRLRLKPRSGLKLSPLEPDFGWCDAPEDRNYNRFVHHPYPASAERLWRCDRLYDVVIATGHNQTPRIRGLGSAIFLHCAHDTLAPTEGCVALRYGDMRTLLSHLGRNTVLRVVA